MDEPAPDATPEAGGPPNPPDEPPNKPPRDPSEDPEDRGDNHDDDASTDSGQPEVPRTVDEDMGVEVVGTPGPGISPEMLDALKKFVADEDTPVVVWGSRQTGMSHHTGRTYDSFDDYPEDTDLDLAATRDEDIFRLPDGEPDDPNAVPGVKHPAMGLFTEEEAIDQGLLLIKPLDDPSVNPHEPSGPKETEGTDIDAEPDKGKGTDERGDRDDDRGNNDDDNGGSTNDNSGPGNDPGPDASDDGGAKATPAEPDLDADPTPAGPPNPPDEPPAKPPNPPDEPDPNADPTPDGPPNPPDEPGSNPNGDNDVDVDDNPPNTPSDVDEGRVGPEGFREFDTDEAGHRYGQNQLGDAWDGLSRAEQDAVNRYTSHAGAINNPLRETDPVSTAAEEYDRLRANQERAQLLSQANGGTLPQTEDALRALAERRDLTPDQRAALADVVNSSDPFGRLLDLQRDNRYLNFLRSDIFDGEPTGDAFRDRVAALDRALDNELPEPIVVIRGARDLEYLVDVDGQPLNGRDPRVLIGAVQRELGVLSTSLGATPGFSGPIRMEFALPEGSRGLWVGDNSWFPSQRELALPRNTEYVIMDVFEDGPVTVVRAVVVPPAGSVDPLPPPHRRP